MRNPLPSKLLLFRDLELFGTLVGNLTPPTAAPVSAGLGKPRLLGKATVTVAEVGTQTRSVAEELWDFKNNWAEGGKVTFKKASPELFPPPRPVYDQFQIQLGRIKTAGREIEKFKELFLLLASLPSGI